MTEIIHNYSAGKDGTIIFGPWEDAEANNHMAYYIENIINFANISFSFSRQLYRIQYIWDTPHSHTGIAHHRYR